MAKTKALKRPTTAGARPGMLPARESFNLDELVDKYMWMIIPLLVLLYWWFGSGSTGFYQDDEIGHYRNIRQFWGDPFSIMGNQPKPGWKILMVVPGLLGFPGVMLAHCLVAALTVFATYKLGRALGFRNSVLGALLLASQPLWLQLAFRSYSEITAGLFAVLMLWSYAREKDILAAVFASYVFSIRQEFALVAIGLGIMFLFRRKWIPFLVLGWTPVVLALLGWLHTGDIMWLIHDMTRVGTGFDVPHKPFWHYFGTSIYIFGPVALALAVAGYWTTFAPWAKLRETMRTEGLLFLTFTVMFGWSVFSAWDYQGVLGFANKSPNPGHWRYVLTIAPLVALYAVRGIARLSDAKTRGAALGVLGAFALIVLAFMSLSSDGLKLIEPASYTNFMLVLIVLVLGAVYAYTPSFKVTPLVVALTLAAAGSTLYAEKPRKLDSEAEIVKQATAWYLQQPAELQHRALYCNHVLFRYFADIDINDKNRDRSLQLATLEKAPKGSVVMWDSHYGNSQFGGNVPMTFFENNPSYKLLNQFVAPDQRFGILAFEKVQ